MAFGNNTAQIKAVITAEDRASATLQGFGKSISRVAKILAGAFVTKKIIDFGVNAVKAFQESEDAIAQTNAVLKSTKGVAGVSSKAITDLATSLQKVTKFSDEQVRSGENLLLTFTKIGKDIFPEATETMLNMSQALGQDVKSSAIQLGKALQDPILGVTALRRVGVNFSEKQRDVIKKLVETGKSAQAQKLILKELQVEFGNSARAAGETFSGKLTILKNRFNDLQENIGQFIVNGLFALFQWFQRLLPRIQEIAKQVGDYLMPKFVALWNTISKNLIPALIKLWQNVIQPMLPVIGTALVIAIGFAIDALNFLIKVLSPVIDWLGRNKTLVTQLIKVIGIWYAVMKIRDGFNFMINSLTGLYNNLSSVIKRVGGVKGALGGLNKTLTGFTGWAIFATAAITAFDLIINKAEETKSVLEDTASNVTADYSSINQSTLELKKLIKTGTPTQKKLAQKFLDARAEGGPVTARTPYLVGEHGPEIFTPSTSGKIVSNDKIGGDTINISVNAGAYMGSQQDARRYAQMIINAMSDIASSKNKSVNQLLGIT